MTYPEAEAYLERIGERSVKHPLAHTQRLLEELGSPDLCCPAVHVAGTNGKGSVCAYLESALTQAGVRTALFTSPHLIRLNERMRVDGQEISDQEFAEIFTEVHGAWERLASEEFTEPSYFEYLCLCAWLWFSRRGAELAVIETGMGGLLDATSAGRRDILSVITSVSLDHTAHLGGSLAEIAAHKAGIIRGAVPCVYLAADPVVRSVVEDTLERVGAPGLPVSPGDWEILPAPEAEIDFSLSFRYDGDTVFSIRSAAPYQVENAALAVRALRVLRQTAETDLSGLTEEVIASGLSAMRWPGRMEELLPRVFLDGAHNPDGIARFLEAAGCILRKKHTKAVLLFSAVQDKDSPDMIHGLVRAVPWERIYVTEIEGWRRTEASVLAALFRAEGARDVRTVPEAREALREALSARGDGCLFICGSLYLAGMIEEYMHD